MSEIEERRVNGVSSARNDSAKAGELTVVEAVRLRGSLLRRSDFAEPTSHQSLGVED